MKKRILILGSNGFVGKQLSLALHHSGHEVIALARHSDREIASAGIAVHLGLYLTPEDFRDQLSSADLIIHAASSSTPGKTARTPLVELEENLRPTLALISALQDQPDCHLLYISSGGTLYGDCDQPANEQHAFAPRSYYAANKIAAEQFIQACTRQFSTRATILRPSNLYGPGQPARPGFGVIPAAFGAISRGVPFELLGNTDTVRDYLYIDDFVDLCQRVVETPSDAQLQIFNASCETGTTLGDLIEQISAVTGHPLSVATSPARSADVHSVLIDSAAARATYGWKARTDLREGLERTWHWWKSQA